MSATLATELPKLAAQMEGLLAEVQAVVAENREAVNQSTTNVAELTEELKGPVQDLKEISGRLARGEGTIGKLLTSDEAHEELVSTLGAVQTGVDKLSDTLGRVQRLRLDVDMQGWVLADGGEGDSGYGSFGATLFPSEDSKRMYRLGLVQTPRGELRTKTQTITTTLPDGGTETTQVETLTEEDTSVLSALVGYRLDSGTRLWTGLIEDDFGVQVEQPFLSDKLWVEFQAFNFNREMSRDPHLRLTGRWFLNKNLYVVGGYDDPLESEFDSLFIGGGIRWTDDDLKYLLGSVPTGGL
jgi:phospholipid/cholesterol/gamma-HCH transport system substrate-binding protein